MTELRTDAWLSLEEAARRLGVSRLRLREAIAVGALAARRDNHGFWRVSLEGGPDAKRSVGAARVPPQQLIELLFDEIEELTALLAERSDDVARLGAVVDRQQVLLDRALRFAESADTADMRAPTGHHEALHERSHALIDRALSQLAKRDAELVKVTGLLDRAMGTATALDAEVVRQNDVAHRQRAMIDRLFALAQTSLDCIAPAGPRGWLARWRGSRERRKQAQEN